MRGESAAEIEPDQVAELVVLLCSPAMRGVTGQAISIGAPVSATGG